MPMKIVSLFSGAGGLDLGFENAGFHIIWANEYDKTIWDTFQYNFPHTILDKRSITDVPENEVPDCDGLLGGPPCQSWSEAGAGRGIADKRGAFLTTIFAFLKQSSQSSFLLKMFLVFLLQSILKASMVFLKILRKLDIILAGSLSTQMTTMFQRTACV